MGPLDLDKMKGAKVEADRRRTYSRDVTAAELVRSHAQHDAATKRAKAYERAFNDLLALFRANAKHSPSCPSTRSRKRGCECSVDELTKALLRRLRRELKQ